MTDVQVVPTRAAVAAVEESARNSDSAGNNTFFAGPGRCRPGALAAWVAHDLHRLEPTGASWGSEA